MYTVKSVIFLKVEEELSVHSRFLAGLVTASGPFRPKASFWLTTYCMCIRLQALNAEEKKKKEKKNIIQGFTPTNFNWIVVRSGTQISLEFVCLYVCVFEHPASTMLTP